MILSASFDKSIKLWDGFTGTFLATLRGHVGPVYQVAWSSDSRLFVSGSKDSTLKVGVRLHALVLSGEALCRGANSPQSTVSHACSGGELACQASEHRFVHQDEVHMMEWRVKHAAEPSFRTQRDLIEVFIVLPLA